MTPADNNFGSVVSTPGSTTGGGATGTPSGDPATPPPTPPSAKVDYSGDIKSLQGYISNYERKGLSNLTAAQMTEYHTYVARLADYQNRQAQADKSVATATV